MNKHAVYTTQRGETIATKQNIFFSANEWEALLALSSACKEPIGNLIFRLANQERVMRGHMGRT